MKLIYITNKYGDRINIQPNYNGAMIFFAGEKQPGYQDMITLELPGLKGQMEAHILDWLKKHTPVADPTSRRQIYEFPETVWRKTHLDDFLDAGNYHYHGYWTARSFSLEAFSAFADKWLPQVQEQMRTISAVSNSPDKVKQLEKLYEFANRVFVVVNQCPQRILSEKTDLLHSLETVLVSSVKQQGFDAEKWIKTADSLQTPGISLALLADVTRTLASQKTPQNELHRLLRLIYQSPKLRNMTDRSPYFWNPIRHTIRLEQTVFDETIDVSQAKVQKVEFSWELFGARRVGRIVPGRQALVLRAADGAVTYIGSGREVLFKLKRGNGRIRKFGCTLTTTATTGNTLNHALLEMEQLDTLANVAPQQAVDRLAHLNLPADHPIYQAAAATAHDPRQSRVLADLLIELSVGIDADVARRLTRAQTGRQRRK